MTIFTHANSRALRRGRWPEPGRVYLVTFTTYERNRHFANWDAATSVARNLASSDAWPYAQLLCWVLMPDHFRGLVELGHHESLSSSIGRARAFVSRRWGLAHGGAAPLWSPGFHDRAIRDEQALPDVARHIVANPVRAGLVDRVGDYPFWDAVWL